jgi:DNA-binding transcriptional MerR regulator
MAVKSTKSGSGLVSAQEITKRYKIGYPTINYYTDLGLLSIVKREGNKRLYNAKEVSARLGAISRLMNEGYPLRLIRKQIFLKEGGS